MVTITKGAKVLTIPLGAYRSIYAPAGWSLQSEKAKEPKVSEPAKPSKSVDPEPVKAVEESEPNELEDDDDVEYVDPEDLKEKPLEELDYEELQILAEYLGINIKGMKSSKALRNAIKNLD